MKRQAAILVFVVAMVAAPSIGAQQPDRRTLDADFRLASNYCSAATDSGSLADALSRLGRITTQDPNYPGVKALQDRCGEEYKKQKTQEDLLFAEAKAAYERRAMEEAKFKFQSLANRNTAYSVQAKSYLSLIVTAGPASGSASSQQDYDNLELAKRNFMANKYDQAKPLFEMLLSKGGTIGPEAKKYLDRIEVRNRSAEMVQQGMQALRQRRYQEALDAFLKVQQQDPEYPGLASWVGQAQAGGAKASAAPPAPAAAAAPSLERGKGLFAQKDYPAALKFFRDLQSAHPDSADIQSWVDKSEAAIQGEKEQARLDRFIKDGQNLLRRKEYVQAQVQLRRAQKLAPGDENIRKLLDQAAAGIKQSGQTPGAEDRSVLQAAMLEDGIREFYAGNFSKANGFLQQYVGENGKHTALACFYLGVVASTEFFLTGGKDREKETRAHQLFAQTRRADSRFSPPRDWVSPKIIDMYQKVAAAP